MLKMPLNPIHPSNRCWYCRSLCGTRVRVEHATGKVRPKPWLRRGGGGGGGPVRAPSPRPMRRSYSEYERERERCAYCGERGHPSYDCPRERRGGRRRFVIAVDHGVIVIIIITLLMPVFFSEPYFTDFLTVSCLTL